MASALAAAVRAHLPACNWAIAYGSAISPQVCSPSVDHFDKLVDVLLATDDVAAWHAENMHRNFDHYARLPRALGSKWIARMHEGRGSGVWFHTDVQLAPTTAGHTPMRIKYGIVSIADVLRDLAHWETLFVAGRLQKPVVTLIEHTEITQWNKENLHRACIVAALSLEDVDKQYYSEIELYEFITNLSYEGDVRMRGVENPRKVANIVLGNLHGFRMLYRPVLHEIAQKYPDSACLIEYAYDDSYYYILRLSPATRIELMNTLPEILVDHAIENTYRIPISYYNRYLFELQQAFFPLPWNLHKRNRNVRIAADTMQSTMIAQKCKSIVQKSSVSQSLFGLLSAGLRKSLVYLIAKLRKSRVNRKTDERNAAH